MINVFSKEWFARHQTKILKFVNTSIGRGIIGLDLDKDKLIVAIDHGSFAYIDGLDISKRKAIIKHRFFTNHAVAQAFHKKLSWVWKAMHAMDGIILDHQKLVPDFGFATYNHTFSRADSNIVLSGNPWQNSGGGDGVSWSTLHSATGNNASIYYPTVGIMYANVQYYIDMYALTSNFSILKRYVWIFDTSILNDITKSVTEAKIYLKDITGTYDYVQSAYRYLAFVHPNLASSSTIVASDFSRFTTTLFGSVTLVDGPQGDKIISLNSTFLGTYLNKSGNTQIGIRIGNDYANVAPTWASSSGGGATWRDISQVTAGYSYLEIGYERYLKINIGDSWKEITDIQINIGDSWKSITDLQINIGDSWKKMYLY